MKQKYSVTVFLLTGLVFTLTLQAQQLHSNSDDLTVAAAEKKVLRIATMHAPPFSIKKIDGGWDGLSINLWHTIAEELDLNYKLEERSLSDILEGLRLGEIDVAVAALTITEQRELQMDFTHPVHSTGLAIATKPGKSQNVWFGVFQQLFSWQFIQVVGLLVIMLLLVGWLIWLVEHKHEPSRDDSHTIRHISEGFWWAAATMTTVGYGDKTPLTKTGRALGVIWMFTALMIVASFIAAFSSVLTVKNLGVNFAGPEDLVNGVIATVPASTSEIYLNRRGLATKIYPDVENGLNAVVRGEVFAMVYDAPLMQYLAQSQFAGEVEVLPVVFERQDYGFALRAESDLREPVNRILLRIVRSEEWANTVAQYLGR